MSEERVSALTSAIKGSRLWIKWKRQIAANHKWVRTVDRDCCRWRLISDEPTLPISRPPEEDPTRPWRVFPELDDVAGRAVLFDPSAENLVASDNELGSWDENQAVRLLESVDPSRVFSSSVEAEYLARFLEELSVRGSRAVQSSLCELLRRGAAAVGLQQLTAVAARIKRIAVLIAPERKLTIKLRDRAEYLVQQPTTTLVWPEVLDDGETASEPDLGDVELLLRALAMNTELDAYRRYAEELLGKVSVDQRRALLARVGDLPVLGAFNCQRGQKTSVSAYSLREAFTSKTLFRTGQGTTERARAELGPVLQAVLLDEPVLIVNKELVELALGEDTADNINVCDARGVLRSLAHHARRLGDVSARRELLRQVRLPDRDVMSVRGMRFLLHGCPEHLNSDGARLWVQGGDELSAWRKMWLSVLAPDQKWTIVEPQLAAEVAHADWAVLDLRPITPEQVAGILADTERIVNIRLDDVEYATILAYERWDEKTWKSLPFHETNEGKRVAIGEATYLEQSGIEVPAGLLDRATVILRSFDPRIAALQNAWIPKLNCRAAILLAVGDRQPDRWCREILDWLIQGDFSGELLRSISDKPWLRMRSGHAVKPRDVVDLPEIEDQVSSIVRKSGSFATLSMLPDELHDHPTIERFRCDLFPHVQSVEALLRISEAMGDSAVGEISVKQDFLAGVASVLENVPDSGAEAWAIVSSVCKGYGDEEAQRVFKALCRPISVQRMKMILRWLPDIAKSNESFEPYLQALAREAQSPEVLRDLRLRCKNGSWKPAADLCYQVPSADRGSLLCDEHGKILKRLVRHGWQSRTTRATVPDNESLLTTVQGYFTPWLRRGDHIKAQVGAVITLIAGFTVVKDFATTLLAPHSREWFLKELPWRNDHSGQPLDGMTPEGAFARCSFRLAVDDVTHISCVSLLGESLRVPLERKVEHLLVGDVFGDLTSRGDVYFDIRFRKIDISAFADAELSNILRATGEQLMRYAYLRPTDLQGVWAKLDDTQQLHVETAESLILEYLPFYLGQLRPSKAPKLTDQLQKIDDHRRLAIEYQSRPEAEQKRKDYEEQRKQLQDMLTRNADVQRAVLEAVQQRLRDSHYQSSSIPFELFQNADDAYVQLSEIWRNGSVPKPDHNDRFVVVNSEDGLSFLHWGRPVNSIGPPGFEGRERGYHRDLEKMLTLSSSEKQMALDRVPAPVTGKFGLGFKSVLLACDRPQVSSGSLQFEIVGGVLPRTLSGDAAADLRRHVDDRTSLESTPGTLVRIYGTPNPTPLPAFHPPPGHIRSSSIRMPISRRSSSSAVEWKRCLPSCRSAIMLKAVGMTQLVVPDTQLHPYFVGSNFTRLSKVWNFQRQNRLYSRPLALSNHSTPETTTACSRPIVRRAKTARAVAQQPLASSPAKAGQLPS
jgi:hypothetical protein